METTRDNSLDAGLLTSEEKQALQAAELPAPTQSPTQRKRKGFSPYLVVALIVGALLTLGVALGPRMTNCMRHHAAKIDDATFSQLLHSANPESLRQLLHDRLPEKYGKGMFPSEKDAVEAVHEDDAPLATNIVKLAARQDDNNSTSEEPSEEPTTTSEEETTTTEEPTETTTSDDNSDDETTTSEEEPTTTSDDSDDSETSPTPDPSDDDNDDDQGTSVSDSSSSTGSDEPTSSSSSAPSSSTSSSEDQDSTSSSEEDKKTSSSKGTTITSTNSEGHAVTITSYADAEQPTNDDGDDEEEGDPDLQDAGARPAVALLPVLAAVAGAAFML